MKRIALLSIAVAGVVACNSDRALPPGPAADIQDGNHLNGNRFFFWLPPTINQNAPATQVFSRNLRPIVTITDRGPSGAPSPNCHPNNTVRTFSGSDINVSNSAYRVDWHTDLDDLHAECTYRITVNVGPRLNSPELGYADVDVVNSGKGLKNVDTDEFIPLLDGRTLPIRFFAGVGSTCSPGGGADCGEGIARPGQNTVIVTTSGNAGVFIPAGAVDDEVTITIQSVDERFNEGEQCIPRLFDQFPGTPNTTDNACYEYRTDPPLADVNDNENGTFNVDVTVGICPPSAAMALPHETLDEIVLFRFDDFGEGGTRLDALENSQAPFLRCDPHYSPSFGSRGSLFGDLARAFESLIVPRPLYASSRSMMFDVGAGGQTDGFSRFTWALPNSEGDIR